MHEWMEPLKWLCKVTHGRRGYKGGGRTKVTHGRRGYNGGGLLTDGKIEVVALEQCMSSQDQTPYNFYVVVALCDVPIATSPCARFRLSISQTLGACNKNMSLSSEYQPMHCAIFNRSDTSSSLDPLK